jgi:carbamoyltransferase
LEWYLSKEFGDVAPYSAANFQGAETFQDSSFATHFFAFPSYGKEVRSKKIRSSLCLGRSLTLHIKNSDMAMNVLGIHYGHNSTVCLMQNGTVSFIQSEERLNRLKNSVGFPRLTLDYVFDHLCSPEKVDFAVLSFRSPFGFLYLQSHGFKSTEYGQFLDPMISESELKIWIQKTQLGWKLSEWKRLRTEKNPNLQKDADKYFCNELQLPLGKIEKCDHHLAHAYSALPNISEWGCTLVFTLDGVGDWNCATVNLVQNNNLEVLRQNVHQHSLGYYYNSTTGILGMKMHQHEFKVMGLAPYSKEQYYKPIFDQLSQLLDIDDGGNWVSKCTPVNLQETLTRIYQYKRFDNIAGAIQLLAEERICKWIRFWIEKTGCSNVALSGGVFMNVKACQKVLEMECVDKLFVVPSAADESTAYGAAVWGTLKLEPDIKLSPLQSLYLGKNFTDEEVIAFLNTMGVQDRYDISEPEDINKTVAELLADNKIVARCSGAMEFGARALGNRSILANPSNWENVDVINKAIKSRDFWMPFTPSILDEDMERYVVNHQRIFSPYMVITFDSTEEARKDLRAAIHPRDFTLRPQCVTESWNSDYYKLIKNFKKLTGIGGVLNTSFNLHGEPNVCSPEDAIHTVDNSDLEYLVLNSFLLKKKKERK